MPDREKIISNLQILRTWASVNPKHGFGLNKPECERAVEWIDDALELLTAQETELCDRCGRRRLKSNRVEEGR